MQRLVDRDFRSAADFFTLSNLTLLYRIKPLVNHYRNMSAYFTEPRLKAAFTFQNMYLSLSPYDAPATYSLLQYTELAEGVWYPLGGMYAGIQALVKVAEKLGVKFKYNTPVKKILTNGNKKIGVQIEK